MLSQLLRCKLSAISDPKFRSISETIKEILNHAPTADERWRYSGQTLFRALVTQIGREEQVAGAVETPDLLTRYVPNFISAILRDLDTLLFHPSTPLADPTEQPLLVAHLLLRLAEWTMMNYEWECLYGPMPDSVAAKRMEGLRFELEIWGDRDEIWLNLLEITEARLPGISKRLSDPVLGCQCYWAKMDLEGKDEGLGYLEPSGVTVEHIWIEMGIKTLLTDQTVVKTELKAASKGVPVQSLGKLEGEILATLGHMCGTPFSSLAG